MADRRRIEERIKRKEQEIQLLEGQVKDAKVYIQALHDVLKMFPREEGESSAIAALRPGSLVALAREAVWKQGAPLHIDEMLKRMGKPLDRTNKTALSGSLAAYVRKGQIFTRPAPNTFGLVELEQAQPPPSPAEPPPDFGLDDDDEVSFQSKRTV